MNAQQAFWLSVDAGPLLHRSPRWRGVYWKANDELQTSMTIRGRVMSHRFFSLVPWPAVVALLMFAQPGQAQDATRTIAIEIHGKAEFDVLYQRAMSNATGAVLGGLIGAGIQAGIESSVDAEKRAAIYPHVAGQSWRDVFIKTMTEALAEKGLTPVWIDEGAEPKPGTADIYLDLYPGLFGFRIVDTSNQKMAAFIEFDAAYSTQPPSSKNRPAREPFYITDKTQVYYQELLDDTSAINPRIESVLKSAARRLTNKVVYNVK